MSSHLTDQDLVAQLYDEQPNKMRPAFGLHPWWSHHITFADGSITKQDHYHSLFPNLPTELFESFPEPTPMSRFIQESLRPHLEAYPQAMLGEVGLDKSFRIPYPTTEAKSNRSDHKHAKKYTDLKTPMQHQLQLLQTQLEIAFELNRNVSMHVVQAHGPAADLLSSLSKTSQTWKKSTSKICMHSFGGSTDVIQRLVKNIDKNRIYFSFSTTINARLDRLEELIKAVPDNRLLIESDYNDIRKNDIRIWEILGIVCAAKEWSAGQAVKQLAGNWQVFDSANTD